MHVGQRNYGGGGGYTYPVAPTHSAGVAVPTMPSVVQTGPGYLGGSGSGSSGGYPSDNSGGYSGGGGGGGYQASPTSGGSTPPYGANAPPSSSSGSPSGGGSQSGKMTYWEPSGGACGTTSDSSQMVAALSQSLWGSGNPNNDPLCQKSITVTYGGRSITLAVVDKCMGCAANEIDVSPAGFSQLADQDLGHVQVSWTLS